MVPDKGGTYYSRCLLGHHLEEIIYAMNGNGSRMLPETLL